MFHPSAWLKLQYFCHAGDTEVGGFGLTAAGDPLYVEAFASVRQYATTVGVRFDDAAVADHVDACADAGRPPARAARVWCHTHPGDSPDPSPTDEETFARAFGGCDWAVMFVLSRTGRTYARLAFAAGPGGAIPLPVAVDWAAWPPLLAAGRAGEVSGLAPAWADEFGRNVCPVDVAPSAPAGLARADPFDVGWPAWMGDEDWWGPDEPPGPGHDGTIVGADAVRAGRPGRGCHDGQR